jgi:dTMP kinase
LENSILIAIEGIDGAGKTTQVRLLRESLERAGLSVVASKEPTNGKWGKIIKDSATAGRLSLKDELNAFLNDRAEHVQGLIAPALAEGKIVILDRYFYSTIAYQGSRGANVEETTQIMNARFPIPDAVFLLDVDPVVGIHRIANSRGEEPNHFEERENLGKAREIFNTIPGDNIIRIDGSMSIEVVHSNLIELFVEGALKNRRCAKSYGCDDVFNCSYRLLGKCEWFRLARVLKAGVAA